MLPPAFIAQLGQRTHPARVAVRPRGRLRAVPARPVLDPAGRRRWPIVRVIAWTAAWMAFEWWAVIGWPDALEVRPAALMMGGVVTLVGLAVWRDVREPTSEPAGARIVPLRRTLPGVAVAVEESAEAELDAAA